MLRGMSVLCLAAGALLAMCMPKIAAAQSGAIPDAHASAADASGPGNAVEAARQEHGQASDTPEALAQRQLAGYNARDIDAFLEPYSEDVALYQYPGQLIYRGKAVMRERYSAMFARSPHLHCELVSRVVIGNVVIDQESVSGHRDGVTHAVAIYTVSDGKISRVEFLKP